MTSPPPPTEAMRSFTALISDAEHLVALARGLSNTRKRSMRRELRDTVGEALSVSKRDRAQLDCVESSALFVVLKPGSQLTRTQFEETELRPLLRQAVVATATAIETFVVASAMQRIPAAFHAPTNHLKKVPITLGEVLEIEANYTRRRWGHKEVLARHIQMQTSANPDRVADTLRLVGVQALWNRVDKARGERQGTSESQLRNIVGRRNRIAHSGDRSGRGRAPLSADEVARLIEEARSIAVGIDQVLSSKSSS